MRSKRYQEGSLQKRKHGRSKKWVLLYWENSHRRYKTLGAVSQMTHAEAMGKKQQFMQTLNDSGPTRNCDQTVAFGEFVQTVFLPFCRRKWKESTTGTTEQRIKHHLVRDLGGAVMQTMSRTRLQDFLE